MVSFLITLDVIVAILIIIGVFFHRGSDGFMGDSTPAQVASGPKFETYDKIIGILVLSFFVLTFSINYLIVYKEKGTVIHQEIAKKDQIKKRIQEIDSSSGSGKSNQDAPLAQ